MGSWNRLLTSFFVLSIISTVSDGAEEGARVKRVRAPAPLADEAGAAREPAQALDAEPERAAAADADASPHTFLSPSVKDYLELGMAIPGKPGTDYPILGAVPYTSFYCDDQPYPGFFADMESRCQAWHYCDIDGRQASFLCPNGTVFSQGVASCDWWFNVQCARSPHLYALNARLYRRRRRPRPAPAPAPAPAPHRHITKEILDDIFV